MKLRNPIPTVGFLTWSSPVPTGGNVYDDRLTEALRALGVDVHRHHAPGTWPADAHRHRDEVAAALESPIPWLVDSIVAYGVPDLVVAAADRGQPLTILLHSLLSTEVGLSTEDRERYRALQATALQAAGRVIATSRWAADDLRRRYRTADVVVARPGVVPAPLAAGSPGAARLLSLGSVTATKDQLGLVEALGRIADLPWTARVVGGDRVHPDYTAAVHAAIRRLQLDHRVTLTGPLVGSDLDQEWEATDLLVLTSRSETYGMVVVEALSRGIPAVVCAGTGAVEALGAIDGTTPGAVVPAGDPVALAGVLRRWLNDSDLRRIWRTTARQRRETLTTWESCARTALTALVAE
ncbi:MAG: glycosyltransferase family 4 protein [Microlunatus sp.]|nr:glycosyltransferase family 4 protein [Microlunatus sp.]MDN5769395.1 glycosyltransferase family 4 protein [Microlunatus sp.]